MGEDAHLTLNVNGKPTTQLHRRPYLLHTGSLVVITVQIRAWMDTVGLCMWVELQLGPYYKKWHRGRCCIIWDQCPSHTVPAVALVMLSWGIVQEPLPKNMTDILQVMDLVVNGPVKAGIRRFRIEALFNYFQSWEIKRLQHDAVKDQQELPPAFAPPKPSQAAGLLILLDVLNKNLCTEAFEASMRKCFVTVGFARSSDGEYVQYSPAKKGYLKSIMPQVAHHTDAVSVGEVASELELTSRPMHGPDGELLEGEGEEGSGEEGAEE